MALMRSLTIVVLADNIIFLTGVCPKEGNNICSPVDITNSTIGLNLTILRTGEECCCHIRVLSLSDNPTIRMFFEYDCKLNFTKKPSFLHNRDCSADGKWERIVTNKENDICVSRVGTPTSLDVSCLVFDDIKEGHAKQFNLVCNGSELLKTTTTAPTQSPLPTTISITTTTTTTTDTPTIASTTTTPSTTTTTTTTTATTTDSVATTTTTTTTFAVTVTTVVAVLVTIIIIIAVAVNLIHRKNKATHPPLDDKTKRHRTKDNSKVIMQDNPLYMSSGADNTR